MTGRRYFFPLRHQWVRVTELNGRTPTLVSDGGFYFEVTRREPCAHELGERGRGRGGGRQSVTGRGVTVGDDTAPLAAATMTGDKLTG